MTAPGGAPPGEPAPPAHGGPAPQAVPGARVLLAEDERHLATLLERFLAARGADVVVVSDGQAAVDRLGAERFDVALLDLNMPRVSGLEVLRRARALPLPPEVVIITGNATPEVLAHALRDGAYDVVAKPYRMVELELVVRRAAERRALAVHAARLASAAAEGDELTSTHAPLRAVLAVVDRAARGALPVLVQGEPGVGKRALAARVHRRSGRPAAACVTFDCAAHPAEAHDALLFGGTDGGRADGVPLVTLAEGGTLVLAHVDALAPAAQARLRALLGAPPSARAPRVVCTSAADLDALAAAGRFDAALLERVGGVRVTLPPLRERRADVRPIVEAVLRRPGRPPLAQVAESAAAALEAAPWPGNVRELRAVLEIAALRARGGVITCAELALPGADAVPVGATAETLGVGTDDAPASLAALERAAIARALDEHGWHQGRAAEALGISARTLYRKIRALGFTRPRAGHARRGHGVRARP